MIKVLVVEGDALIASGYQTILEEVGWQVLGPSATPEEALELLHSATPSVAMLDVDLNGRASTAVAEALIEQGIPFVLVTNWEDPVARGGECFRGKADLRKWADPRSLISALNEAMTGRK